MGYNVEMLIVGDDISLPDNKHRAALPGRFWCTKWPATSPNAHNLATVLRGRSMPPNTFSHGLAAFQLSSAAGSETTPPIIRIRPSLGWGSHGEPGASVIATQNSAEIVTLMVEAQRRPAGNRPPGGDDQ